jgi:flagellar hook-associated protein 3 FlgL
MVAGSVVLATLAYYNLSLSALTAILFFAIYHRARERHKAQQQAFAAYVESLSFHIDQAGIYALHHLPMAIIIFDEAGKVMIKAQELTVASGSGAATGEDRHIMGVQVEQLLNELNDIADTKYDDRPLFASGAGLFSASDMAGLDLAKDKVFGPAIEALEQLKTELLAGNPATAATSEDLSSSVDNLLGYRTGIGARMNRLEGLESRLLVMEQDLINRQSQDEEVDMAKAMVDLKEEETAYQAALSATARIMRVSLVDFL